MKRELTGNIGLKFFSLAAAVLLFYLVNSESNTSTIGFSVPLEIQNIPPGKVLVWPLHKQIQVTIRGPSYVVSDIAASPPSLQLRMPREVNSRYKTGLRRENISLPPSVQVMSFQPNDIELVFDALVTKEVKVRVPKAGVLPKGINLLGTTADPDQVSMKGPENELKKLDIVDTEPLPLHELDTHQSFSLGLALPSSLIQSTPDKVAVEAQITAQETPVRNSTQPETATTKKAR